MTYPLNRHHRFLLCALLALFACSAGAQDTGAALSARFPAGSIATVEAAESARQQAAGENARIERQYAQDGLACDTAFFVNACRDKVKERRRAATEPVHRVQIEADTVMRRIQAAGRDQALADRRREQAEEAVRIEQHAQQRAQETAQKQVRIAEKDRVRVVSEPIRAQDAGQRTADHQARQQRQQTQTAAEAQKRAANVASYDRKIRKAHAHQRDIAAKKAEKDRSRKNQPPATTEGSPAVPEPALAKPASKP